MQPGWLSWEQMAGAVTAGDMMPTGVSGQTELSHTVSLDMNLSSHVYNNGAPGRVYDSQDKSQENAKEMHSEAKAKDVCIRNQDYIETERH